MKKITWWSIVGEHSVTLPESEAKKKMESLDSCDIMYSVEIVEEGDNHETNKKM